MFWYGNVPWLVDGGRTGANVVGCCGVRVGLAGMGTAMGDVSFIGAIVGTVGTEGTQSA